jgi:hypothetical protein
VRRMLGARGKQVCARLARPASARRRSTRALVLMRKTIAIFCAVLSFAAMAAAPDLHVVPYMGPDLQKGAYLAISDMSTGPWLFYDNVSEEAPAGKPRGERWRVVVVPPSEEGPTGVVLEKITMGPEGCCLRLRGRWQLEAHQDLAAFRVVEWRSPTELVFSLGNDSYVLAGLGTKVPAITSHEH